MLMLCATACATASSSPPHLICPPLVKYTAEFQASALDEIDGLPASDPVIILLQDYAHLRAKVRAACPKP